MTDYEKIARWLLSKDTGASSEAIVANFLGMPNADKAYPIDVYDFGRCYRMLKACPDVQIECMRQVSPVWARLVFGWTELTRFYEIKLPEEDYHLFRPAIHGILGF